jgi:hypothetical protein
MSGALWRARFGIQPSTLAGQTLAADRSNSCPVLLARCACPSSSVIRPFRERPIYLTFLVPGLPFTTFPARAILACMSRGA